MLWIERVLVGFLAYLCEQTGLDADRLAEIKSREAAARTSAPDPTRTQTVYRIR